MNSRGKNTGERCDKGVKVPDLDRQHLRTSAFIANWQCTYKFTLHCTASTTHWPPSATIGRHRPAPATIQLNRPLIAISNNCGPKQQNLPLQGVPTRNRQVMPDLEELSRDLRFDTLCVVHTLARSKEKTNTSAKRKYQEERDTLHFDGGFGNHRLSPVNENRFETIRVSGAP